MAKQNYSKTEKAVDERLNHIKVTHLLELADAASGKGKNATKKGKLKHTPGEMIQIIEQSLKWLHKINPDIYKHLKITKSSIKTLDKKIHDPSAQLEDKELKQLKIWMKKILGYKEKNLPPITDEKIIEAETKKHLNKRHNVNEKWLPLK